MVFLRRSPTAKSDVGLRSLAGIAACEKFDAMSLFQAPLAEIVRATASFAMWSLAENAGKGRQISFLVIQCSSEGFQRTPEVYGTEP